ncbi:nuclear transport factor 2 family protein [Aquimarina sp. 2201CG14-23]|uniref:nuclear transport factor 2 family protein n=1 Tax=Aquimarina mycalae TaxID=3040073 RepID=UPI002477D6FA|nr:nuclear transport factor 2 family protein [Aquimarina sp. 2201CG14-23]MDH7445516.1 nuclear transport factor 2 family protein [Aquimarina sp. 2201CG14-23]
MKHTLIVSACILMIISCKTEHKEKVEINTETTKPMEISNKEKAVALLTSLETGDQNAIGYINPNKYIQHNLAIGDGLEGFGAVMQHAPEGGFKANVVRSFTDGAYTFTHTIYDFFGPKIGFDVFRYEDGKIVEHWDNLIDVKPVNPSGNSQTDGPTTVTDLDKTDANKELVQDFVTTILLKGEMDKIQNYIEGDNYIQHNPDIANGLSGLGKALEAMAKQGIAMVYTKVHKVLGEGNFVLTISEGTLGDQHTSFYDLFRVENGKIVEHWDVVETIMPEADRKNTNGKFNFSE